MRFLLLVTKDIVKFMCGRTIIFVTIMAGLIFNTVGISFYYGYFMNIYNQNIEHYNKTKSYDFISSIDLNEHGTSSICDYLLSMPSIQSILITPGPKPDNDPQQVVKKYSSAIPMGEYSIEKNGVLTGRYFNNNEIEQGANVTIASSDVLLNQKQALTNGDALNIAGNTYTIIGQIIHSDIPFGCIIPLRTYLKNNVEVKYIHAIFSKELTQIQKDTLTKDLMQKSPALTIVYPPSIDENSLRTFWANFSQIIVLFMLAMVNKLETMHLD